MIEFAIITAPRQNPTIDRSIQSLRSAYYYDNLKVFAEPEIRPIKSKGVQLHLNDNKLGCFKNFHKAFSHLAYNSRHQFICVLSDDFIYSKNFLKNLTDLLKIKDNNNCYYALFTPIGMKPLLKTKGWNEVNKGWGNAWGGLYVMNTNTAKSIIEHEKYKNHLMNYTLNEQIDHIIPEVCYDLGIKQYYNSHSMADHIGTTSTLGHKHTSIHRALNFR